MENTEIVQEKSGGFKKKIAIVSVAVAAFLILIYFAGVWFYSSRFLLGTKIGSFGCSNMTVDGAKEKLASDIENYGFTFYEKEGKKEVVKGSEISLVCAVPDDLQELQDGQNAFLWFIPVKDRALPLNSEVTFNRHALYNRITQLDMSKNSQETVGDYTTKIYYEDGQYRVDDNGIYNVISINDVYQLAKEKVGELSLGMSLEKEGCYKGLDGDDDVKGVLNLANKFVSSKITYKLGGETMTLDGSTINQWVKINENCSVKLDNDKIREYVGAIAKKCDTVGKERSFKTSGGETITVSGGDYGWKINSGKEVDELTSLIWEGKESEREPAYIQKANGTAANDIGGTYVEVSIGSQHMWYYKDGSLIVDAPIVSGDSSKNRSTTKGVYRLKYKDKNVVLRGEDYATPVTFWMPFNGGIGLHDATWRGSFGGSIYRGNGSHGCVNLPYSAAQKLYSSVSAGEPVIVY